MIYRDTSVALAQLLAVDRGPPVLLWREWLASSRLLKYELWNRINARRLARSHGEAARALLGRVALLDLAPTVLVRALEPFPVPLRTLDALHLSAIEFLRGQRQTIDLASYDARLNAGAEALGIALVDL